jgi:hypothetical protein
MKSNPRELIRRLPKGRCQPLQAGTATVIPDFKGFRDLTARPSRLSIDVPVRRLPNFLLRCELALRFFSDLAIGVGPPIYTPAAIRSLHDLDPRPPFEPGVLGCCGDYISHFSGHPDFLVAIENTCWR